MNLLQTKRWRDNLIALSLAAILFISLRTHAQNSLQLTKAQWLEDLSWVTETLRDTHPNILYRMSNDDFQSAVREAEQKIERSESDDECLVAIRRVVASIYDGHTMLGTGILQGYADLFPVRMYEFTDGIFITGIHEDYAEYVGARVLRIGLLSADEAFRRAGTLAFADNEFSRKNKAPLIVVTGRLAHGIGITEAVDALPLVVEAENGKHDRIVVPAVTPRGANYMLLGMDIDPEEVPFVSAFTGTEERLPLYLKHLDGYHNYWFEHDKEHRAVYMQFNLVADHQEESFNQETR
jgi:hypothetical protein